MNLIKKKDIFYGDIKENKILPMLNDYFKCKAIKLGKFNQFDFIDKKNKVIFELKSRRILKNKQPSTMVGYNKILKGFELIKEGYKVYFIFCFEDYISSYNLDHETYKDECVKIGGRTDRGKIELKKYAFISTNELINLFLNKKNAYYIINTEMQKEKQLSYTDRLIAHIESNPTKVKKNVDGEVYLNYDQISQIINEFSLIKYNKENTNDMPFGKYKHKQVSEVAKFDLPYLKWLVKQDMMERYEELRKEINKYI